MGQTPGVSTQGHHSHILTDGGMSEGFFWSGILAKRDFFGSMNDMGIFLGHEKNTGIFWVVYFSAAQVNNI